MLFQDPKLLAALVESRKRQAPYAGAFLVKDDPGSEATGSDTEKNIYELKGKELLNRLHEVGTLAQVFVVVQLLLVNCGKLVELDIFCTTCDQLLIFPSRLQVFKETRLFLSVIGGFG